MVHAHDEIRLECEEKESQRVRSTRDREVDVAARRWKRAVEQQLLSAEPHAVRLRNLDNEFLVPLRRTRCRTHLRAPRPPSGAAKAGVETTE